MSLTHIHIENRCLHRRASFTVLVLDLSAGSRTWSLTSLAARSTARSWWRLGSWVWTWRGSRSNIRWGSPAADAVSVFDGKLSNKPCLCRICCSCSTRRSPWWRCLIKPKSTSICSSSSSTRSSSTSDVDIITLLTFMLLSEMTG